VRVAEFGRSSRHRPVGLISSHHPCGTQTNDDATDDESYSETRLHFPQVGYSKDESKAKCSSEGAAKKSYDQRTPIMLGERPGQTYAQTTQQPEADRDDSKPEERPLAVNCATANQYRCAEYCAENDAK
jgi:hypothetical protein